MAGKLYRWRKIGDVKRLDQCLGWKKIRVRVLKPTGILMRADELVRCSIAGAEVMNE